MVNHKMYKCKILFSINSYQIPQLYIKINDPKSIVQFKVNKLLKIIQYEMIGVLVLT